MPSGIAALSRTGFSSKRRHGRPAKGRATPPGEVYLVSLDPTLGAEIQKTLSALIVQNDIANRASPITIVAAITASFESRLFPTEVLIRAPEGGLATDSVVLLNQIRPIDRQRLVRRLGRASPATMGRVDRALRLSLGLVEL